MTAFDMCGNIAISSLKSNDRKSLELCKLASQVPRIVKFEKCGLTQKKVRFGHELAAAMPFLSTILAHICATKPLFGLSGRTAMATNFIVKDDYSLIMPSCIDNCLYKCSEWITHLMQYDDKPYLNLRSTCFIFTKYVAYRVSRNDEHIFKPGPFLCLQKPQAQIVTFGALIFRGGGN